MEMTRFHYEATDANHQVVTGEIVAASVQEAAAELEARGLTLRSIARLPTVADAQTDTGGATTREVRPGEFVPRSEQEVLQSQLQRVLDRADILLPALKAYAQDLPAGREHRELQTVVSVLEQRNAAEAVKALRALPGYWIPLLSATSQTRDSGRVLRDFLQESQRSKELRRQWWLTLAYPVCLLALAGAVLVGLSFIVVPVYRNLFLDFQINLPALTQFVVNIAEAIVSGRAALALIVLAAVLALLWSARYLLPQRWAETLADGWSIRFGRSSALARFSHFAADLLETDTSLPEAVRLAGIAVANGSVGRAAGRLATALEQGELTAQLPNTAILTHTIRSALQSPLPLATRVALLREISECYSHRTQHRLSWTRGIIEPVAICLVGLIVGITALALFMPLIRLTSGLAG